MPKLNSTFELAKTGSFKHKTEVDASVCTVVRNVVNNVRTIIQEEKEYIYVPDFRSNTVANLVN